MNHINGVTELNIIEVYETPWWLLLIFLISCVLFTICIITLANLSSPRSSTILTLGIFAIILVLVIAALGLIKVSGWFDKYSYTRYEVLADDTVNINEFNNTYEIIEQRGQIYVVRFKE